MSRVSIWSASYMVGKLVRGILRAGTVISEKTDAVHELFERASPAEFNGALNRQGGELR